MKIRDSEFVQKVLKTIAARHPGEIGVPDDLSEDLVLPVLDIGRFLPTAEMTGVPAPAPPGSDAFPSPASTDLYTHSGERNSPAGGAGQFSCVGDLYGSLAVGSGITRVQLVYLRVEGSVEYDVRVFHYNLSGVRDGITTAFRNMASADLSLRLGYTDFLAQTNDPDAIILPQWGTPLRTYFALGVPSATTFEWGLDRPPLVQRTWDAGQARAIAWLVNARAAVTAITVQYTAILRVTPDP